MKKSEKIIIGLTVAAALYGGVDYLIGHRGPAQPPAQAGGVEIAAVRGQLTAIMRDPDDRDAARLAQIMDRHWSEGIFFDKPAAALEGAEADRRQAAMDQFSDLAAALSYSGYLEMNNRRIAIINGLDYREGEEVNGFTIEKIAKDHVQVSRQGFLFTISAPESGPDDRPAPSGNDPGTKAAPVEKESP